MIFKKSVLISLMHLLNKMFYSFGWKVSRTTRKVPKEFTKKHKQYINQLRTNPDGFNVINELHCDIGVHPADHVDYECGFASHHISRLNPKSILDIGSNRYFILGMLSNFRVTTIDIRERTPISNNEIVVVCDAKKLNLPDNKFDVVVSLCALEHFGLGRYGDEFDMNADKKALSEMIRVLKPNGRLILSTTITRARPTIVFNAHRIYSHKMLRKFLNDLICEDEKFFSKRIGDFCSLNEITEKPKWYMIDLMDTDFVK